ncbi:MAG: DNA polymerase III subunit gamma/tau [Proteobacteria bacterium]|nr:DNA polymerase III subunit gamma/tau [Pseudomonadota bacterium]
MTYLVLARKYRPRSFSTLVGQEHVVKALRHALEQQRLHHAYLFTGTRGVGKTTIARILAKCLNCETGITAEPCGKCSACMEIDGGRFVDLLEVDAATNTKVDEMRQLLETAQYAPSRGRFKVYVIDEVHMLSNSAFNAMLKTLEEPPEHLKFVLATTDPQKIPVTVLSRCLQFNLKQMPPGAITEHLARLLEAEGVAFEKDALPPLARAASGSMRDGLSLLDQAIAHGAGTVTAANVREMLGAVDETYLLRALDALAAGDGKALMDVADEMQVRSLSFDGALADLASLLLRIALAKTVPDALDADLPERARIFGFADGLAAEEIQLYYQIAVQGRQDLPLAPDEHSGFVMTLLRMLAFRPEGGADVQGALPGVQAAARPAGAAPRLAAPAAPRPAAPAPAAAPVRPVQAGAQGTSAFDGNWPALARDLQLGGAAKLLAENSELQRHEGGQFELCVPKAMAYLAEKNYTDKLKLALAQRFGGNVSLRVSAGEVQGKTVAAIEQGERTARQARAADAVHGDPFVRDLVDIFDATVIDKTINATSKGS